MSSRNARGKGREAVLSQFSSIFTQMVALFAAIGVGYICKKTGVMDADFDKKLSGACPERHVAGADLGVGAQRG